MPDEFYPDDGDSDSPSSDKHERKKDKAEDTELVSKKFLHIDEDETAEKGKVCKVRVEKDWGSEVEISYVKESKKDKEDSDDDGERKSADDEIDEIEESSMTRY